MWGRQFLEKFLYDFIRTQFAHTHIVLDSVFAAKNPLYLLTALVTLK